MTIKKIDYSPELLETYEENPHIFFHLTGSKILEEIDAHGFRTSLELDIGDRLNSISFAKTVPQCMPYTRKWKDSNWVVIIVDVTKIKDHADKSEHNQSYIRFRGFQYQPDIIGYFQMPDKLDEWIA